MKISPVGAEFHADGQTDMTMLYSLSTQFCERACNKICCFTVFPCGWDRKTPETSVMQHQPTPPNVLEERRPQVRGLFFFQRPMGYKKRQIDTT